MGCVVVVGLAAGCGDDAGPQDVVITNAQAQAAGSEVAGHAASLVSDFTLNGVSQFPAAKVAARAPLDPHLRRLLLAGLRSHGTLAGAECAALSDTTDSDGDGVPNDLTISFASPACTTMTDSGTVVLSGSVHVSDPGANPGFDIIYSNIRLRFDDPATGDYVDARLNGTQGVGATTTSANLGENLSLSLGLRSSGQFANLSLQNNWTARFDAAQGLVYDPAQPLPDGAITLSGSSAWSVNTQSVAFGMSTSAPLVYDSACTLEPPFASGQLRALVVGNRGGAFVRVQFVGCGQQPVITLVGQPAS